MSLIKGLLNCYLRVFERPFLERVHGPDEIRKNFNFKARFLFHGPLGVQIKSRILGGRPGLSIAAERTGPGILYFHGGAYVFGSPATHSALVSTLAKKAGARAYLQDYSKAPEAPFPAAIEDAEAAWLDLIESGENPKSMIIGGDSAGGGLALALLAVLIEKGHPLPAGTFAFSPLTDLTFSGASVQENGQKDVVLPAIRFEEMAQLFLGDTPRDDPRASPLYADFAGSPPVYLMVGDTEILRDDTLRMRDRMQQQSVDVSVDVMEDLPHVWPMFHNTLPEARQTLDRLAVWIKQKAHGTAEN